MFFGVPWVEWFGYAASLMVAVSLMMSSIIKLRWINLVGSAMFSTYGFVIGSLPVGFLNLFIVVINVVNLLRMYREKDDFRIMSLSGDSEYLAYFLKCHRSEIEKYFPLFDFAERGERSAFYLVKNSNPIGLLIGHRQDEDTLLIELDYVGAQFRDFKMGSFVYRNNEFFLSQGYKVLKAPATGGGHDVYLEKMGFRLEGQYFVRTL